ncbi:amino acid/amide ABC transporter membrane protein 2 (HAAT family) [Jezberella montanilacus]|uniref:Amino acid/amide ABC transporter membrane protein 2 (HAAT family) n=1 Tax=Jezberella montanilacus TaxID=323426 RepID=A0A2T0XL08_9BURK|nr:branched-chain amino acid ABC transporter permease [Jezberella montanilacus]PRY99616.1 amino acid/amide ABC transporter membrane protein 2 (HAAT family) [Jezberella montanilacus]
MIAYLQNIAVLFCVNGILALTLNFIMGYAGIYSLAHTIFFGIGAYTAAYLALNVTDSLLISMLVAFSLSALVSMALALPALRVRGEYFVAASLGLQVIGVTIFAEWKSVTGGLGGMIGIPRPRLFSYVFIDDTAFLILSVIVLLAVLGILSLLVRGSFGRSLMAIRDSESAAQAYGKHVNAVKTLSVAISSGLAAIAGVLYTFYMSFINVEGFTLETSILLMAMVIIGGTGTLLGPVAGAALLMTLPAALTYLPFLPPGELGAIQQIVYGAAMVVLMIFRPGGLVGGRSKEKSA